MEKVKGFGKKVAEAGKTGKSKLDEIRTKDWAEPTGAVLKAAANIAGLIPPPAGGLIEGALNMGASLLNPDPTLADLRRAKEEIKEEVRSSFKDATQDMSEVKDELSVVRDGINNLMEMITEKEFYKGIEDVQANYEYFIEGMENLRKTVKEFRTKAADFQTTFKRNFKVSKIFKYLKIVKEREGNLACEHFYQELLSAYGKFLQIIVVYLTFNGEHHRIKKVFSKFIKDYIELSALFNGIQEIPEEKEVILKRHEAIQMMTADMENLTIEAVKEEKRVLMRWQETVKHMMKGNEKDEFDKAELTILNKRANLMEVKASFGFLDEANTSFNLVFEGLRQKKKFGPSQRIAKLKILNKIVSFHNIKGCPDEAYTWALSQGLGIP